MNPFGIPEITAAEVNARREAGEAVTVIDVREAHELRRANVGDWIIHMPMSTLAQNGIDAIPESISGDPSAEYIIMCHHGSRSAQVSAFMRQAGYTNVLNLTGGIHAWSMSVDPSVPTY